METKKLERIKAVVERYKQLCTVPRRVREVNRGLEPAYQFTYCSGDRRWTRPAPRNP